MGSYGLMKAASGCPGNNVHWQSGWRKQDTEDINAHNYFSPKIGSYMAGECVTLLTNTYTITHISFSTLVKQAIAFL